MEQTRELLNDNNAYALEISAAYMMHVYFFGIPNNTQKSNSNGSHGISLMVIYPFS